MRGYRGKQDNWGARTVGARVAPRENPEVARMAGQLGCQDGPVCLGVAGLTARQCGQGNDQKKQWRQVQADELHRSGSHDLAPVSSDRRMASTAILINDHRHCQRGLTTTGIVLVYHRHTRHRTRIYQW